MMYKELYTDRLILRLLNKKWAEQVLDFLKENRDDFSRYEAEKPSAKSIITFRAYLPLVDTFISHLPFHHVCILGNCETLKFL